MRDQRDMLEEIEALGATATEIGLYWYLILYARREQSNPISMSKGELGERLSIKAQELQNALEALQDDYMVIEILKNKKSGRGKGLEIRIIPFEKYVRPSIALKELVEGYVPEDDPAKWGTKDVVKKFIEYWEECFGTQYVVNWGRDCSIVKNIMFGKLNLTGEQIKMMFDYVFLTKKGYLYEGKRVYALKAFANIDEVNTILPEAVAHSKKKKRPRESPSVTKIRKEMENKEVGGK